MRIQPAHVSGRRACGGDPGARVAELRKPPHHLDVAPDEKLEAALNEAFYSRGTVELLTAVFRVIRPALLAAYESHQAKTNPLFDYPTSRLLRIAIDEERDAMKWGEAAIAAIIAVDAGAAEVSQKWAEHLGAYLLAAGGVSGNERSRPKRGAPAAGRRASRLSRMSIRSAMVDPTIFTISTTAPTMFISTPTPVMRSGIWR